MNNKKAGIVSNFLWRALEQFGAQGVAFVVSIVLARLLNPDAYGLVAIIAVFTGIFGVFVDSGLGSALIQKKDADNIDFSSVFFFNMMMCVLLYALLFFSAPLIARFYDNLHLVSLLRVAGITLIVSGLKNVQQAYIARKMMFKKFFFATLGGTIGAAVLGITLAYLGFGVWALIAQNLFNLVVDTTILWITVDWRPELVFSLQRLKALVSFGWKILASKLLDTVYINIRSLVIGKVYTSSDLGLYNRGNSWPNLFVSNISNAIDSVLFPAMSNVQENISKVKDLTRRSMQMSVHVIAPLMLGLFAVSTPLVRVVLTDKWIQSVPYLRIFCVAYIFYPIRTANMNAIRSIGRSDIYLKLEVVEKVIGLAIVILTMKISVMALAYSFLVTSVLAQLINSIPNKKLLEYGYFEQLKDILPSILIGIVMAIIVYLINYIPCSDLLKLSMQIPVGVLVYILGSMVCKVNAFYYIVGFIRKK